MLALFIRDLCLTRTLAFAHPSEVLLVIDLSDGVLARVWFRIRDLFPLQLACTTAHVEIESLASLSGIALSLTLQQRYTNKIAIVQIVSTFACLQKLPVTPNIHL